MSDEKYVISGPPDFDMPEVSSFGEYVLESLKLGGDKIAQIDGITGDSTTCNEILQRSVNLAAALRRMGYKKGDVFCISSENRFEFTVTAYAVFFIGGIVSTLNITYSTNEIIHALNLSKPRLIFCSSIAAKIIGDIVKKTSFVQGMVLYGDKAVVKATPFKTLIAKHEDVSNFRATKVDPVNDHIVILCSSGTTGLPKGVMLTHSNFIVCAEHFRVMLEMTGKIDNSTTIFSIMPWFHAYGFVTSSILTALHIRIVFAKRFEEELYLRILQDHKVTIATVVPPIVLFLAKHPSVEKYDLSSLKELWCGAAPLSRELQIKVTERLNLEKVTQGYGMTETTLGTLIDASNGEKPGTAGLVVPGVKAKIVDLKTGKTLGPNKEGELCFKSALLMKGYVGDTASTEQIFDKDGWMHTGDIAYYDDDEYFYIVDRLKELIKYKSFQVPPAELEAILIQHKDVKDAAVIGVPDEEAGELPMAFIVRQENATVTAEDIADYVAQRVSPAKKLRGGVRFVNDIPKNPSGKLLRRELKELIKKERMSKL